MDIANCSRRIACILRGRVLVGRSDNIDQVMRDGAPIFCRDLVSADVEAAIDSRRIAIDDLAVKSLRQRKRERGLPRGGRPDDRDDRRWRHRRYRTRINT